MATVSTSADFPAFDNGDRMTRAEFHRVYEKMPEDFRAELVGGIVHVASPLRRRHGTHHAQLASLLVIYQGNTPGVETADNATILLGDEGEPQPDLYLRILPEFGGQSGTTADDYVQGAPELIVEIALSSRAIDLFEKRDDYRRYGVAEYLVVCLLEGKLRWFDLRADCELTPDADGVYRMHSFPGLWVHGGAFFSKNHAELMSTLQRGLATAEHAEFVNRLATTRSRREN